MGFVEKQGLRYFQFDLFEQQPLLHGVITRNGGFSQPPFDSLNTGGTVGDDNRVVLRNHQRIFEVFDLDFSTRLDVWQVHGTQILCGDEPRDPDVPHVKADGILTDNPDVTLFMRFADCVPILLYDPLKKVIGIIHAGWQGTYKQITRVAIEKMEACYGSKPETILAGIGPSICQDCYQVGSEVIDAFRESFGQKADQFFTTRDESYYLDLWAANRETLLMAGVRQIESAGICTACHLEDWYSHRAENGSTGRFGVLMRMQDN